MEEKQVFNTFCELVSSIAKRPAMYQISNIENMYAFILGYITGRGAEILLTFQSDFREFVNEELADDFSSKKDYDWPRLIRFYSAGDMHSIELFGQLFEQFTISFIKKYGLASS